MNLVDIEDCELDDDLVLFNGLPYSGRLISKYENGTLREESSFLNGLPHGLCLSYYFHGQIQRIWSAFHGRVEGISIDYYENGQIKGKKYAEFGVVLSTEVWGEAGQLLQVVEIDTNSDMYKFVCRSRERMADSPR